MTVLLHAGRSRPPPRLSTTVIRRGAVNDIQKEWRAHLASGFPPAARGREVNGVDLVLVDTHAAGCIRSFVETGALDAERTRALQGCVGSWKEPFHCSMLIPLSISRGS